MKIFILIITGIISIFYINIYDLHKIELLDFFKKLEKIKYSKVEKKYRLLDGNANSVFKKFKSFEKDYKNIGRGYLLAEQKENLYKNFANYFFNKKEYIHLSYVSNKWLKFNPRNIDARILFSISNYSKSKSEEKLIDLKKKINSYPFNYFLTRFCLEDNSNLVNYYLESFKNFFPRQIVLQNIKEKKIRYLLKKNEFSKNNYEFNKFFLDGDVNKYEIKIYHNGIIEKVLEKNNYHLVISNFKFELFNHKDQLIYSKELDNILVNRKLNFTSFDLSNATNNFSKGIVNIKIDVQKK